MNYFKNNRGLFKIPAGLDKDFKLAYTQMSEGAPSFYVFNREDNKSFIILSAVSLEDGLLGYGTNCINSPEIIPVGLKELLKGIHVTEIPSEENEKDAIQPLISTKWNQTEPYNNTIPTPYGDKSRAGCVATAMAQIIKYHRFPNQPVGTVDYTSVLSHYSDDLSNYKFDFDNMIDDYVTENPTEAQIKAVNDLFYCCGMSVDSDWGTDVTTAKSSLIPERMKKHFRYNDAMGIVNSSCFTKEKWEELIYAQLRNGWPVMISSNAGKNAIGHEFICDGYDGNGYYHINWGWGGALDGFFRLSSLYSYDSDIDFTTEGYGNNQDAIINVFPENNMKTPMQVFTATAFSLFESSYDLGDYIEITCHYKQCSGIKTPVRLGLRFTDISDGYTIYSHNNLEEEFENGVTHWSWTQNLPVEIRKGTYMVTPAVYVCRDKQWQDINLSYEANRFYIAEVSDSKIKIIKPTAEGKITLNNAVYPEAVFYNRVFSATAELANESENDYYGNVGLCVLTKQEDGSLRVVSKSTILPVQVKKGDTCSIYMAGDFTQYSDNDYYIGFMEFPITHYDQCVPLGDLQPVLLEEYAGGTLIIDDVTIANEGTEFNPTLTLNSVFHCEDGYYNGPIFMDLVECDENGNLLEDDNPVNKKEMKEIALVANTDNPDNPYSKEPQTPVTTIGRDPRPIHISTQVDGKPKDFSSFGDGTSDKDTKPYHKYRPRYKYYNPLNKDLLQLIADFIIILITWDNGSDVGIPAVASDDSKINYYHINGTKLQAPPTSPGIYIKIVKDGKKIQTKKIAVQ